MEPTVQNRGFAKKETVFNDSFEEFFLGPESNGRKSAEMVAFTLDYFRKRPHLWKSDDSDDEETKEKTILKQPNSLHNSERNENQRERKYQKHTKSVFDTTICPTIDRGSPKALVKTKAPSKGYEFFKKHLNWKSKDIGKDSSEKKAYDNRRSDEEYFTKSGGERESRSHSKPQIIYTKAESSQLSKYSSQSPAKRYSRAPPSEAESIGRSKSRTRSRSKITYAQRESPESHRRVRCESPRRSNYETVYSRRMYTDESTNIKKHQSRSRSQPRITSTLIESPRSDYSSPKRLVRGPRVAKECSKNKHISRERLTPISIDHQEMKDPTGATLVVTPTLNCPQEMFDAARRTLVLTPSPGRIGQSHGSMHVSIQLQYRQPSPR